jgi:hypothetical protein
MNQTSGGSTMDSHYRVATFRQPLMAAAILLGLCSPARAETPAATQPAAIASSGTGQPDARFGDVEAINRQVQQDARKRAVSGDGAAALARAWNAPAPAQPEAQGLLERYPMLGALAAIVVLSVLGAIIRTNRASRKARAQRKAATADLLKQPPRT